MFGCHGIDPVTGSQGVSDAISTALDLGLDNVALTMAPNVPGCEARRQPANAWSCVRFVMHFSEVVTNWERRRILFSGPS
jgi:hypothetical protein